MPLSKQKIEAAVLVAQDELSDEKIAEQIGVTRRTLANWKKDREFSDYVDEENRQVQAAMLRLDIAKRHKRVSILDDLLQKSLTVISERAQMYAADDGELLTGFDEDEYGTPAGGRTGLLTRQVKILGTGEHQIKTIEYQVDTGLVKQITSLMEQAASELGQKVDKVAVTGTMVVRRYIGVTPEDV